MQHDFDLMIRSAAFDDETVSVWRGQRHRIDQQAIAGSELKLAGTIHFLVAGKGNVRWFERIILWRSRKVDNTHVLVDDTDEKAIDLRGIGLVDFSLQPCRVLCR